MSRMDKVRNEEMRRKAEIEREFAVIFAWSCVLSDRPPVLWWLSPGEGWDAVTLCGWDKL